MSSTTTPVEQKSSIAAPRALPVDEAPTIEPATATSDDVPNVKPLFDDLETIEWEDDVVDVNIYHVAKTCFSGDDIDAFLNNMTDEELVKHEEFNPEAFGYEPVMEQHECEILFTPSSRDSAIHLMLKPWQRTHHPTTKAYKLQPFFFWRPRNIIRQTMKHTTQMAMSYVEHPMRRHKISRNPVSNVFRLNEIVSTDPMQQHVKTVIYV